MGIQLTKLPPNELAGLLAKAGAKSVTLADVEADIACGAPTNPDGSINLVAYAAWLVREESRGS